MVNRPWLSADVKGFLTTHLGNQVVCIQTRRMGPWLVVTFLMCMFPPIMCHCSLAQWAHFIYSQLLLRVCLYFLCKKTHLFFSPCVLWTLHTFSLPFSSGRTFHLDNSVEWTDFHSQVKTFILMQLRSFSVAFIEKFHWNLHNIWKHQSRSKLSGVIAPNHPQSHWLPS